MDCNEKATYIQTIIHCIKRTLENKSADQELKSQSAGLLNRGKHDNIRERIELLTQDPRSKSPLLIHGLGIIVCLVFMISSYCFILQPEYPAPDADENGEPLLGSEDITIFKEAEFNLEGRAKLVEKDN